MSGHIFDGTLPFSCKKFKKNFWAGPTYGECFIQSFSSQKIWNLKSYPLITFCIREPLISLSHDYNTVWTLAVACCKLNKHYCIVSKQKIFLCITYCSYSWILPKEAKLKLPSPTDLDYNLNGKPLGGQVKKIEKLHNFLRKSTLTRSPLKNQFSFLDWTSWYSASIF